MGSHHSCFFPAYNLSFVGRHHSGLDDCKTIAQIVKILLQLRKIFFDIFVLNSSNSLTTRSFQIQILSPILKLLALIMIQIKTIPGFPLWEIVHQMLGCALTVNVLFIINQRAVNVVFVTRLKLIEFLILFLTLNDIIKQNHLFIIFSF